VGVEQIGEIAVKSRYLALGYWCKPDLTRTAFLEVPEAEPTRFYRTGDLGLMRANGCLEYCGRKDFQVKIRGHRIEIEEIELALLTHDAIKEAVVVAEETLAGEQRLVAYLVVHGEVIPGNSELRRFLAATLPTYMIPAVFVWLPALPLTPNGKVDRRALPAPSHTSSILDDPFVAPCSPIEQQLADIWATLLGVEKVGRHDNFFDLGGHSLTAAQIASRVRDILHVDVPLRDLLEASTVAAMAAVIVQYTAVQADHNTLMQMLAEVEALSEE
jgi:non-ribosomal peptide synthetase component F